MTELPDVIKNTALLFRLKNIHYMAGLIISKLDYSRLKERALRAKVRQPDIAVQADSLLQEVARAILVESTQMPPDIVTMNSVVQIVYLNTNKTMNVRIVYPELANVKQNR